MLEGYQNAVVAHVPRKGAIAFVRDDALRAEIARAQSSALELIATMQSAGPAPTTYSYNCVFAACAVPARREDGAAEWTTRMRSLVTQMGRDRKTRPNTASLHLFVVYRCSFMYRYILRESCSQFDSLPRTSL
jgi:hypothetical protein